MEQYKQAISVAIGTDNCAAVNDLLSAQTFEPDTVIRALGSRIGQVRHAEKIGVLDPGVLSDCSLYLEGWVSYLPTRSKEGELLASELDEVKSKMETRGSLFSACDTVRCELAGSVAGKWLEIFNSGAAVDASSYLAAIHAAGHAEFCSKAEKLLRGGNFEAYWIIEQLGAGVRRSDCAIAVATESTQAPALKSSLNSLKFQMPEDPDFKICHLKRCALGLRVSQAWRSSRGSDSLAPANALFRLTGATNCALISELLAEGTVNPEKVEEAIKQSPHA
jgi:hypothetical protein